ncbi:MAG: SulP family inorganic anion transporter [Bacteroidetes bacterium]|nr:SulP family inorganic anion transporter [Bacteroidota bacterium]
MKQHNVFSYIKNDFISGLIVFLIALPLCLGIALASGAPLFSGIVSGIVGGIVVGLISKSSLSVTGPAAGLIALVLSGLHELGTFQVFLCAVMVAGAIQLVLGILKAGTIANYFPGSVIEGMLAGIGLTIIIKQLPDAVGYTKQNFDNMVDADDGFTANIIEDALAHIEPVAALIAILGISILILWQNKRLSKMRFLPGGLVVVILAVFINEAFHKSGSAYYLDATHLVNLPVAQTFDDFLHHFTRPDFSGFSNPKVWQLGLVIAAVASIETLLCIEATDKLDPLKRYTPTDRELKAQGIGNMLSGLIGGLPVTSVIVRSSANINAGAKSKLSTMIHGVLLLICVSLIPTVLNLIPKSALAAILIYTGYRLCKPAVFVHIWKEGGRSQFIPFAVTAISVVSLDLLKGVGIGLVISIFYLLRQNMRIPYYFQRSSFSNGELVKLTLAQEVSFLNKASIKQTLESMPSGISLIIDASQTEYIDFDVLDIIRDFQKSKAPEKNIKLSLIGFKNVYKVPAAATEMEVVSHLASNNEMPNRSAGGYKKLLRELATENEEEHNNDNDK